MEVLGFGLVAPTCYVVARFLAFPLSLVNVVLTVFVGWAVAAATLLAILAFRRKKRSEYAHLAFALGCGLLILPLAFGPFPTQPDMHRLLDRVPLAPYEAVTEEQIVMSVDNCRLGGVCARASRTVAYDRLLDAKQRADELLPRVGSDIWENKQTTPREYSLSHWTPLRPWFGDGYDHSVTYGVTFHDEPTRVVATIDLSWHYDSGIVI